MSVGEERERRESERVALDEVVPLVRGELKVRFALSIQLKWRKELIVCRVVLWSSASAGSTMDEEGEQASKPIRCR